MKRITMAVLLVLCASLAACRSAGAVASLSNAKPTAVEVAAMDEPIAPPKPAAPQAPAPSAPKVATPAVATSKPVAPAPKPMTETEAMKNNIIAAHSAAEQVRVDLGSELEAVAEFSAARLAALEQRVGALKKATPAPAPAPATSVAPPVVSASFNVDDLSALKRAVAWDHPTLAKIFLGRLRTAFQGGEDAFWSALGNEAPHQKFKDWLAKARGIPKP